MSKINKIKLGKLGKMKFNEVVEYLKSTGKYAEIDNTIIEVFAKAYEDYIKYSAIIDKEGAVVVSDSGNKYANPNYTFFKNAQNVLKEFSKILGIGSYNRDKLGIELQQEEDEFLKFLRENNYDDEE